MQTVDIRKLNQWLKSNVPFYAKARKGLGCVEIYSETGCNLHAYADQISETFGLRGIQAYGLPNYLTVPLYV